MAKQKRNAKPTKNAKDSPQSTESSTPTQNELTKLIILDENKYQRKGFGLIVAILIAIGYITLIPEFIKIFWPKFIDFMKVNNLQEWQVFCFGIWGWHIFWLLTFNSVMYLIYHYELPFFEKYKINSNPWPWYENLEEWKKLFKKSIFLITVNNFMCVPGLLVAQMILTDYDVPFSFGLDDLPSPLTLLLTIAFNMICEDLVFHLMHKLGHNRYLYPYIHKHHHNYITSVSIAGEHFHPIDFFLGALIPGSLGPNLLGRRMHFATYLAWIVVRTGESVDGHTGYEFSWSPYRLLPFATSASYHDFHHTHNTGNFSSFFTTWDTIFSDNATYYEFEKEREKQIKEKREGDPKFNQELKDKLEKELKKKRN